MSVYDLTSNEGLRRACEDLERIEGSKKSTQNWRSELAGFIRWVRDADLSRRATLEFQRRLWEENPVTSVGQGNVSVEKALENTDFRDWLAKLSLEPLPESREVRLTRLGQVYDEILNRIQPYCSRAPRLKVLRVLAAVYPLDFTTVSDGRKIQHLQRAMFAAPEAGGPVARHRSILDRLEEVLGQAGQDIDSLVRRMTLPWLLYAGALPRKEDEITQEPTATPGEERLIPLPAARRRRGLTAMRGGLQTVLGALDFVRDGVTRDELRDHLRAENPELKDNSINMVINVLRSELAVIRRNGDNYLLTERGQALLESSDPGELSDWLLTHILGVDHALVELRDHGPQTASDLVKRTQVANPGWTTEFIPSAIVSWLRSFDVIATDANGRIALTPSGIEWAKRIHWTPERLGREEDISPVVPTELTAGGAPTRITAVSQPPFEEIYRHVSAVGIFNEIVVKKLHAGLWAHPRRHFAILTGLSGSGKTLLAREYGGALTQADKKRMCRVAVQPGWYDPAPMLGYVNPLRQDAYVRTPFLEFLLAATADAEKPYVTILDEMNLSHPEQYLAPVLSAMEIEGGEIDLHRENAVFDGVPRSIQYPSNLVLIGTVNMDETTHGLSDKVLDRAFTLEFWDVDLDAYPRWERRTLSGAQTEQVQSLLKELMEALKPARLHFGWRIVDEVLDFLERAAESGIGLPFVSALDGVVYAKVLPKLRGDDSSRFRDALEKCAKVLRAHELAESHARVGELIRDLESTGSARFWR